MKSNTALPTWTIDGAHSSIGFTVRHLVVSKVRGRFTRWSGSIAMNDRDLARAEVAIAI